MEIKFIKHFECSNDLIYRICTLKNQHWDYPVLEQIRWFNDNLSDQDLHVCIFEKDELIAYTTLVYIKLLLDDYIEVTGMGLGSVCVDKKYLNKKYGFLIVQQVSAFIKFKNLIGVLLCKDELVSFYEKNDWIQFKGKLKFPKTSKTFNLLTNKKIKNNVIELNKIF